MRSRTISAMNPRGNEIIAIVVPLADGNWQAKARGAACVGSGVGATADQAAAAAVLAVMREAKAAGRAGVFLP